MRRKFVNVGSAVLLSTAGLSVVAGPASAAPTFSTPCFTSPNVHVAGSYTVPATGVSEVRAVLRGQNGAPGSNFGTGINISGRPQDARTVGGKGSTMVVELAVTPGQVLTVGTLSGGTAGSTAGDGLMNVSGYGSYEAYRGGNGGDAQYLSTAGADGCQHALAVAAGGGGASGKLAAGGNADAGSGATGGENGGSNDAVDGGGGGAATATIGGTPGAKGYDGGFCHDGQTGNWGEFLGGGAGGNASARVLTITDCLFPAHSAGGGGAGYYYGGGGGSAYAAGNATDGAQYSPGGGGGGSSYIDPSVRKISLTSGATWGVPIAAPVYDTATTITTSPNPSYAGGPVTVTTQTTVVGTGRPVVFGTVQIRSGGTLLATVPVGTNGEATWTTTDLPAGNVSLSATFLSSEDPSVAYRASSSDGGLNQVVHDCAPTPTFLTSLRDEAATSGTSIVLDTYVSVSPVYEGTPQVRWQTSADGGTTWTDAVGTGSVRTDGFTAGTAQATFTFAASGPPRDLKYRAIASTCGGAATSNAAKLTVRGIIFNLSSLPAKTFGSAPFDVASYASGSNVPVAFTSDTPAACAVTGTQVAVLAAGTCTLTASEDGSNGYYPAPEVQQSFTTAKKTITVVAAASPLSQPYGTASAPTVSCTSKGFLGSDGFVTTPNGTVGGYANHTYYRSITINETTAQGSYVAHCSGGNPGPSYTIGNYQDGTFMITAPPPLPLKVTANDAHYTYGTNPPALDATYSVSTTNVTGTLSCHAYASSDTGYGTPLTLSEITPAGSYAIHCTGLASSSYTLSWADGTLIVDPAPVIVTASSPPAQELGNTSAPTVTCSGTGFIGSDGFLIDPAGAVYDVSGTDPVDIASDSGPGDYITKCAGGDPGSNYVIDNYVAGTFTIKDTTAPVVTVPADMTVEATGPDGATAAFTATAKDAVDGLTDVTCDPASGTTLALGVTEVTCASSDAAGNTDTVGFTITVQDTTAPVVAVPADKTLEATGPDGAKVAFTATAKDAVDGATDATCAPASGTIFALGTTQVTCKSTDAAGNTDTGSFTITVQDTTAPDTNLADPELTDPTNQTAASFTFTGSDAVGVAGFECKLDTGAFTTCTSTQSYSHLTEGSHTFQVRAQDTAGNTDETPASFTWVIDTTAPVVHVSDVTLDATSPTGATVPFTAVATDTNPASPAVTCSRASGSTFSIGATDVTCSATDAAGNAGDATFTVTVSGPIAQLTVLLAKVQNLAPAPRKNLQSIVQSALTAADKGHVPATCGKVTSFISQVQALSGKRITLAAADGLLTDARRIMAVLGCS